jgi:hypothetical protein
MKFLNHLNLVENEIRYVKLQNIQTSAYSNPGTAGNIILDTIDDIPKWWDGGAWRDFSYNTTGGVNTQNVYSVSIPSSTTKLRLSGTISGASNTTDDIEFVGSGATSVARTNDSKFTISSTNTQYTATASTGITLTGTVFTVNSWGQISLAAGGSTAGETAGRYYRVATDTAGKLIVNVPWTDTNNNTVTSIRANNTGTYRTGNINLVNGSNVTITETSSGVFNFAATNTQIAARLAGVGLTLNSNTFDVNTWGAVAGTLNPTQGDTSGKWYKVNTDASDKLVVNVPWTDTTTNTQNVYAVSAADGTNTSREKIVLSGSGHNGTTTDFVEIGAGTGLSIARAGDVITLTNTVVNTNTIYSAGNNLTLTGTVFDVPVLTNSTLGVAKTAYAALNNTTLASMGETAAGRVYGIQKNSSNQLVVQIPWVNTVTTNTDARYALSVGAVSSNESTLSLVGSNGGSTTTAKFSGTTNEVEITTPATGNGGDITIGLPNDVTIGNDLTVTADAAVGGNLVVTGNLDVNGSTTTLDTTNTAIKDNIIVLNTGATNSFGASGTSGIEVERGGSLPHTQILWNDQTDKWTCSVGDTSLSMTPIIQNVFTTVTGNSGTASTNSASTALALTGANGITTTAANQGVTISGGNGMTPSKVVTITAGGASGLNASANKKATITHSLGTKDIVVRLYEVSGEGSVYDEIYANVSATTTNACTVQFSANLTNNVRAVIVAAKYAGTATVAYS